MKLKSDEKKYTQWGPWTFNADTLQLVHEGGYEVSLPGCNSSAAILDWICQIHAKSWADDATIRGLLDAFDAVLDPQANYCSGSVERNGDGEALATAYAKDPGAREKMLDEFMKSNGGFDEDTAQS